MAKKKQTKRKPTKKSSGSVKSFLSGTVKLLKDERVKFIISLFSLFFAAFLSLAFISYLFTWKVDQSKLDLNWSQLISDTSIVVENWAGKTGASLANLLIHRWFGVSSFALLFIIVLICFRLVNIRLLPFKKSLKYTLVAVFWSSITLGYFFEDSLFYLGGGHGYFLSQWLNSVIGKIGTFFLLFISLAGFVIFTFDKTLKLVTNSIKSKVATKIEELDKIDKNKNTSKDTNLKPTTVHKDTKNSDNETPLDDDFEVTYSTSKSNDEAEGATNKMEYLLNDKGEQMEISTSLGFEVENTKSKEEEYKLPLNGNVQNINPIAEQGELNLRVEKNEDIAVDKISDEPLEDYDPTLDLSSYHLPPIELLEDHKIGNSEVTNEELRNNKEKIERTLKDFKIAITKIKATIGPTITLYEIVPAPGIRISKIKNLEDDIALNLAALGIRIIAPMPGRGTVGIEVPNQKPEIVSMRSVIASKRFQETKYELPIALGKTISNESYVFDLTKMPHLLVAGATGQGKSVGLNAILASLLYKKHPSQVKLVLVDPKKVELTLYEKIERHFLAKLPDADEAIITDNQKVVHTLTSLNVEMDNRYTLLKNAQVRNIKEYNVKFKARQLNPEKGHHYLPYIVLVVDEFADLIMTAGKEVEMPIARLAQLARAIGIHLIVATQRPSTNIITGVIKANFPSRIAFKVASMIDSRTILDSPGANQLIGRGDMLITQGSDLIRLQCAFIDTPELERITDYVGSQQGYPTAMLLPDYDPGDGTEDKSVDLGKKDDLFEDAARLIVMNQQGSTSLIQRKLSIGYNRAGRIIDQLEAVGIVGPFEGSKARQVLYTDEYSLEQYLNSLNAKKDNTIN